MTEMATENRPLKLWYEQPAVNWEEALLSLIHIYHLFGIAQGHPFRLMVEQIVKGAGHVVIQRKAVRLIQASSAP